MLIDQVKNDLIEAQKERDELRVSTLRLLLTAAKNFAIAKESVNYQPTDDEIISVIQKEVKQRREAIEQFLAGGREELAIKEDKEIAFLEGYLPEQLSEEEVRKIVDDIISKEGASSMTDMGKVMGILYADLKGKADMTLVSKFVREKLS
jgi:uncharacterized protein YqeY